MYVFFYARKCSKEREVALHLVVPWLRRLDVGLLLRRPGFDPTLVGLGVDRVALRELYSENLGFRL